MRISRRTFLKKSSAAAAATMAAPYIWPRGAWAQTTVKVGILHSLTGTIAIAEASVVDAEKLAIEQRAIAFDVTGLFERAHPPQAGWGGDPDPARELHIGDAAIVLELAQNLPVDGVQTSGHARLR